MISLRLRPEFRKLRFQMIADNLRVVARNEIADAGLFRDPPPWPRRTVKIDILPRSTATPFREAKFGWRFAERRSCSPTPFLEQVRGRASLKHWGETGGTPVSKDEEIRVRMGNTKIPTMA